MPIVCGQKSGSHAPLGLREAIEAFDSITILLEPFAVISRGRVDRRHMRGEVEEVV